MKKIKLILASLLIGVGLIVIIVPVSASAQSATEAVCKGIGSVVDANGDCATTGQGPSVQDIIRMSVTVLSYVVGAAAIIMIILGAFKYITSNGDSGKITSAKNTIMYALIGVVVAALAQVLVHFVFVKATVPPADAYTPQSNSLSVATGNRLAGGVF
jgi:hypothetical protein